MQEGNNRPEVSTSSVVRQNKPAITPKIIAIAALAGITAALVTWVLTAGRPSSTTGRTREQVSATSEAASFATSETIRKTTRVVADTTRTAVAGESATAQTRESNAYATATSAALEAHARLTAEAPPTETAQAQAFETTRAQAAATIELLTANSTVLAGPESGQLYHEQSGTMACSQPHATSDNFALQAKFQNPPRSAQPTPGTGWDYGIIFAHPNEELQYRVILDATGTWTLNLHTGGSDISNRDTTQALDTSEGGSNTLKLYVTGENAHLFINDSFIDTLDLTMFEQGGRGSGGYDVALCAGIKEEGVASGSGTRYSGYTLSSIP